MPAMRGLWIVVALVACHHADAPAPVAPKGPTACARASDSLVQAMLARLPAKGTPPTEEADALRNLIRERCEHDAWSAEATRCLIAVKQLSDAEPCAQLMTEDQQAALVRDEQARFGGPAEAPSPVPPAPPAAAPAPEAAPAPAAVSAPASQPARPPGPAKRAKSSKSKGKSTGGDPCSGGE
jgi:2-oxoglutarate dehydrogenase E2 component (dihydrolipoamide succinyltransferase)